MQRVQIDGVALEYETRGSGQPLVFIHGAFISDAFLPLLSEPGLTERYELITYRRRGYGGSTRTPGPISVEQQARDCRALLRALNISSAHVVGHSLGGCIALQLALDSPDTVRALALLEPALALGESAKSYRDSLIRALERYREVGAEIVVDESLRPRFGDGYHEWLERVLPGAFDRAVADASAVFELDIGFIDWSFSETEAKRIRQPVLSVLGSESPALWSRFEETHRRLLEWLPDAEGYVLPGATHALQLQNPRDLADALAAFVARHPALA